MFEQGNGVDVQASLKADMGAENRIVTVFPGLPVDELSHGEFMAARHCKARVDDEELRHEFTYHRELERAPPAQMM